MIVAASFPVVSITLLYGGVRGGQVLGLFVVTLTLNVIALVVVRRYREQYD